MGSSPEVGSSRNTISGSRASARASATRLVMPPESSEGNLSPSSASRPTISSLASAISASSRSESCRYSRMGNCTFCSAVRDENSAPCWNSTPQRRCTACSCASLAASRSTPSTSIVPWRFGSRPMMVRSSTDLPLPEPPTKPRISPRRTSSARWSSTTWSPKPTTRSRTRIARVSGRVSMPALTSRSRRRRWRTGRRARSPGRSI